MTNEQLNELSETLPCGDVKKALKWAAMELEDRRLHIEELCENEKSKDTENGQMRQSLIQGADQLSQIVRYMRDAAFALDSGAFPRDFAAWNNLMGIHYKDPDYGSETKPRPHKDTRK